MCLETRTTLPAYGPALSHSSVVFPRDESLAFTSELEIDDIHNPNLMIPVYVPPLARCLPVCLETRTALPVCEPALSYSSVVFPRDESLAFSSELEIDDIHHPNPMIPVYVPPLARCLPMCLETRTALLACGHAGLQMVEQHMPPPGDSTLVLMCGPPPMLKYACLPALEGLNYSEEMYFSF